MLLKATAGIVFTALLGVSTAQASNSNYQYSDPNAYMHIEENEVGRSLNNIQKFKQKYNYRQYSGGLNLWKNDKGVQKCLEWANAPVNHPNLNPDVYKALYHIGSYGVTNIQNSGGQPSKLKHLEAFSFCDQIEEYQS